MFSKLFGKKKEPEYIVVNVNARVQPLHRGEIYEDPLDKIIQEMDIGTVTGGGTLLSKSGEIENCDIEIEVHFFAFQLFFTFVSHSVRIVRWSRGNGW